MIKNNLIIFIIFITISITLLTSLVLVYQGYVKSVRVEITNTDKVLAFATDSTFGQNNSNFQQISIKDARAEILENYLNKKKSPFANLAAFIVEEADKNNLDFRTIVAIANCESNLGLRIPEKSYNAWGYGIYGDKVLRFESWHDGIRTVSEGLKQNYINLGLLSPEEVMEKYTPPSIAKGGPWAKCIRETFSQLQ